MNRLRRMSRGSRLLVAVVVGGAVFGIATAVQASIPDSNGVAHGCYYIPPKLSGTGQLPGDLRLVDTDKGQHCNADEGSVDLATTGYVQSNVNQTMINGAATFPASVMTVGEHIIFWTCGGWVAMNPTVYVDPYTSSQAPLTLHGMTNVEAQTAGTNNAPFGQTVRVAFNLSSSVPIHTQVQCVDPRVFGLTYPVSAPRGLPKVTLAN